MRLSVAFAVGLIFGLGISVSGMANPAKVINFFDIAGTWDPSLAFVMGGALVSTFLGYRWVFKRTKPLLEENFGLPASSDLDLRLISGSLVFGVGWGIAGFCPGGALPALGTGNLTVVLFVVSLVAGIVATRLIDKKYQQQRLHASN